jgi:hypothetical protein
MRRSYPAHSRFLGFALLLIGFTCLAWPTLAQASFHLNEITKVMVGADGDAAVQAIELKMLFNGENQVNGLGVNVYDAAGVLVGNLGTFGANLPVANAIAGNKILIATMKFRQKFGITPDLQISPGMLVTTGQVSFETLGCLVDAVAYGGVTTFKVGSTATPPLPKEGAAVLVRFADDPTFPSCPLATQSENQFFLTTASSTNPVTFTNNSGTSVNVFSTATAVEATPRPVLRFRITPNPVRAAARIESPNGGRVAIYDLRGRLVRTIHAPSAGPIREEWNGADDRGVPLASGVYFARQQNSGERRIQRFVVFR